MLLRRPRNFDSADLSARPKSEILDVLISAIPLANSSAVRSKHVGEAIRLVSTTAKAPKPYVKEVPAW